jgi:hypothetical protein
MLNHQEAGAAAAVLVMTAVAGPLVSTQAGSTRAAGIAAGRAAWPLAGAVARWLQTLGTGQLLLLLLLLEAALLQKDQLL